MKTEWKELRYEGSLVEQGSAVLNPYLGKIEPLLEERAIEYHCMIVKKLNKIIYRIDGNLVTVVDFWNLRMNPEKLQNRIKD